MSKPPVRAHRFYIEIDGDTRENISDGLRDIARRFDAGEVAAANGPGLSAGSTTSYLYHYIARDNPTHDEYFSALDAWIEEKRKDHDIKEVL